MDSGTIAAPRTRSDAKDGDACLETKAVGYISKRVSWFGSARMVIA